MLFLYALAALAAVTAAIFAVPLRAKAWTAAVITSAAAAGCTALSVGVLASGRPLRVDCHADTLFGHQAIVIDPLGALFIIMVSFTAVATMLYAVGYVRGYYGRKPAAHISLHYTALTIMCLSMLAVVSFDGGYMFLFAWEAMTIASFLLILFDAERKEVVRAAMTYLILMHAGFVLLLTAFVLLDGAAGDGSFTSLAAYMGSHRGTTAVAMLLLAGFGMKAGLVPMHVWLPEAHPAAPSHVSALMSGVMIKMGIYGIARTVMSMPDGDTARITAGVLLTAGLVTAVYGAVLAAAQNDMKRTLAYSSIENAGIITAGMGLALTGRCCGSEVMAVCGMCGALMHVLNHSMFKSLLFFGAGNVYSRLHSTSFDMTGGLARLMPVTAMLFAAATVAICALPPLNGFVSEFTICLGAFDGVASRGATLPAAATLLALAVTGGTALLAFTKMFTTVFLGSPRSHEAVEHAREVDGLRIAAMALPAAGILCGGLFPGVMFRLAGAASAGFVAAPAAGTASAAVMPAMNGVCTVAWIFGGVTIALFAARHALLRRRRTVRRTTWGCGFTAPNERMQYTGESFSEGFESLADSFTRNTVQGRAVDKNEIFPTGHSFRIKHDDRLDSLFAKWWMAVLRIINARIMRLRTGKINNYVMFALLFLALVFAMSLFDLL